MKKELTITISDIKEEIRLMRKANRQGLDYMGQNKKTHEGCEWACKCFSNWLEELEHKWKSS